VSPLDRAVLAERGLAVRRHLERVREKLPVSPDDLSADSDASDAVILHLWQATQIAIDLAVSASVALGGGPPSTYGDAFKRLIAAGIVDADLGARLVKAAGFRNLVAHAYGRLDMRRVHHAATSGPADLNAFLAALSEHATT
jgi:uncharacterized protein YutE (UPF0331/DUF86 family)